MAQELNVRGVLTQAGRVRAAGRGKRVQEPAGWSATTLRRLLTNPVMVGRTMHRSDYLRGADGLPRRVYEPVLADDDWRRLVALLSPDGAASSVPAPSARSGRLLTGGVARCGRCDRPLYATSRKLPDGGTRPFYTCSAGRNGLDCKGVAIDAVTLEEYVANSVLSGVGDLPLYEVVTLAVDDGRRDDIEASIRSTADRMRVAGADIPALAEQLTVLHAERDALPATSPVETREVPTGKTLRHAWEGSDGPDSLRTLLGGLVEAVRVAPGVRGRRGFDPARVTIDGISEHVSDFMHSTLDSLCLVSRHSRPHSSPGRHGSSAGTWLSHSTGASEDSR